jgi:hypothetical protein
MEIYDYSTGTWIEHINEEDFDPLWNDPDHNNVSYEKYHFRLQVNFMIKAGPFLVIDIGPGLMLAGKHYGYIFDSGLEYQKIDERWKFISPNISTGINFIKRFYPIKINAGFLFDVNFNIIHWINTYEAPDYYNNRVYELYSDIDDYSFAANVSFGPRLGVEIMGGTHFGFSVDFLYRYYALDNEFVFTDNYDGVSYKNRFNFQMPGIGIGAGVNYYF